jgi:hypothetical protein
MISAFAPCMIGTVQLIYKYSMTYNKSYQPALNSLVGCECILRNFIERLFFFKYQDNLFS